AAWRAGVLADLRAGRVPQAPVRPSPLSAAIAAPVTVEDAARELVRGMGGGSVRAGRGRPSKPGAGLISGSRLRWHVLARIGGIPLAALRRGDVRRMVDEIARTSARTAIDSRDALRVVLRLQVEREVIPVNVCQGLRAPAADQRPPRFLTPAEAGRV